MNSTRLRGGIAFATTSILAMALISGCSSRYDIADPVSSPAAGGAADKAAQNQSARTASYHGQQAPTPTVRQVVRKADLDVRVDNVEKADKAVAAIVEASGGYTETAASTDLASTHPVMHLSMRVPVASFESVIAKFESLGVCLTKQLGSEDVTGQLVDLEARLKTLRAQEDVYRTMLKGRSRLEDVFDIQNRLTEVRTSIETIDGERKAQAGLAALSTIQLTLEQNAAPNMPSTDPNWVAQAWGEASSGAGFAFRVLAVFAMWTFAFSPFWIPALLILRRAVSPTKARAAQPPAQV